MWRVGRKSLGQNLLNSILINGSHPDSLLNFRGDLIRELIANGYEVHASAPDITGRTRDLLENMGARPHSIELRRAGQNPMADLRYLCHMLALQRRVKPTLILNYTIKPNIWGSFAARLLGIPVYSMVTGLGYIMIEGEGIKRRLIQALAKRLYALALSNNIAVIFQNNDDVDEFVKAGIVDRSKVRVVRGSGVSLAHFSPAPLPTSPVFLMIARLLRTKGVHEYAAAAKGVKGAHPDVRFLLVGMQDFGPDGVAPEDIDKWAEYGIEYLGPKDDVRPTLAEASVYVLPSYREGTPRSVLEAMAMGRPILTTDVPGCRETVRHERNGLLVPARNVAALQAAMVRMIENPGEREAMGRESLIMARQLFDVDKVNRELIGHLGISR